MLPPRFSLGLVVVLVSILQVCAGHNSAGSLRWEHHRRFFDDDRFYNPPNGWENAKPGEILSRRKVDVAPVGLFKLGVTAYQLLYRTTGLHDGDATTSVTTVLIPDNHDRDKLISASVYEDSISPLCAPSRRFKLGNNVVKNLAISYQSLFITSLLHEGWIVTVPDHEGPESAFTAGPLEGHIILDAVRATLSFDRANLHSDAKVIGYGYSGGALANGWAASLQDSYASELNVVGWSLGGTITNLFTWLRYIDGTSGAGFAFGSVMGISAVDNDFKWIRRGLTSRGQAAYDVARHACMYENLVPLLYQETISDNFFRGGSSFFVDSNVREAFGKYHLGGDNVPTPKAPVFMFHAIADAVVPYGDAYQTAQTWCRNGAKVKFVTNVGAEMGHTSTEITNLPSVLWFMRDRFRGKNWYNECQFTQTLDPWFNIVNAATSLGKFWQQMLDLLGGRIGKADSLLLSKLKKHQIP